MSISNKRIINLSVQISRDLAFRHNANELFKKLDNMDNSELVLDFDGIQTISRSFAHQYLINKKLSRKKISEINRPLNVKRMFRIINNKRMKRGLRFDTRSWKIMDLRL